MTQNLSQMFLEYGEHKSFEVKHVCTKEIENKNAIFIEVARI
jgi:hypothetical protein